MQRGGGDVADKGRRGCGEGEAGSRGSALTHVAPTMKQDIAIASESIAFSRHSRGEKNVCLRAWVRRRGGRKGVRREVEAKLGKT